MKEIPEFKKGPRKNAGIGVVYGIYEKTNRKRIHLRFIKRAISYKERILKTRESEIVKECVKKRRTSKVDKERLQLRIQPIGAEAVKYKSGQRVEVLREKHLQFTNINNNRYKNLIEAKLPRYLTD